MPDLNAIGIVAADVARSVAFYRLLGVDFPETPGEGHIEATLPSGVRFMLDAEEVVMSFRSFAALNQRVHALAGHLRREGVKQGDRVGVFLPNSSAIPLSYYATQKIGAVTVILDARLKGIELQSVLQDADLKLLVAHGQLLTEVEQAINAIGPIPMWISGAGGARGFESRFAPADGPVALPRLAAEDDALILYTSGTTGEPKGVVLSYRNLAQYPRVMSEMKVVESSTMRGCILPMSHIVGPVLCNELAYRGYTLVIFDQINPITLLEGIQKYRISVFESVPILFQLLLGVKNLSSYDTSSVKIAAMMGTSIPLPLLRAFQAAQPHIRVIQGYGLTETSPMITLVEPQEAVAKMGSIGRAVPGVEVKIVDENDQEVSLGAAGEIITRGPHVMKGYFRRPDATAQRIRNGWLYTGDVGKLETDGYYYHLGRRDDMIISGGLTIMGMTPPHGGTITFEGRELRGLTSFRIAKLGLGLVPEGRCIFPSLTV